MNLKTNNMSYTKIMSEEIVWCEMDDRHILIKKENGKVIGLNYCQGDELDHFLKNFMYIDYDLTNFYNATLPYLRGSCELARINQAIWAHFEYKNLRSE